MAGAVMPVSLPIADVVLTVYLVIVVPLSPLPILLDAGEVYVDSIDSACRLVRYSVGITLTAAIIISIQQSVANWSAELVPFVAMQDTVLPVSDGRGVHGIDNKTILLVEQMVCQELDGIHTTDHPFYVNKSFSSTRAFSSWAVCRCADSFTQTRRPRMCFYLQPGHSGSFHGRYP